VYEVTRAQRNKTTKQAQPQVNDLEAVVETVRSLWTAADESDPQIKAWLQKTVVDGVQRIKRQVQGRLRMASLVAPPRQSTAAHDNSNNWRFANNNLTLGK